MKKIVTILFIGLISMYAESVQVFKTNTMHLQVDKNTKLEKLFVGTMEEYTKRQTLSINDFYGLCKKYSRRSSSLLRCYTYSNRSYV